MERTSPPRPPRLFRLFAAAGWFYLLAGVAFTLIVRIAGDRWWPATVLMFSPRWLWLLPLLALVPAALWLRRRIWLPVVISALWIAGPLMGFNLPWRRLTSAPPAGSPRLRLLTCNVDDRHLDHEALGALIRRHQPDIVVLQGWEARRSRAPLVFSPDWNVRWHVGLCLASRHPILNDRSPDESALRAGTAIRAQVRLPWGVVEVLNLHLASARHGLEAIIHERLAGAPELAAHSQTRLQQAAFLDNWLADVSASTPLLVAGDFNSPTESALFDQHFRSFTNAFSAAGWGWGYTHYTRRTQLRIDHILAAGGWRVSRCWDAGHVGSAHRPLLADLHYAFVAQASHP